MMGAYSELYLNNAVNVFSEMIDYAVNDCEFNGDTFLQMFIISGIAQQFERGNPRYIAGKSGIELANEVTRKVSVGTVICNPGIRINKTPEYWAGWALAQYQWHTGKSFESILRYLPFSEINEMYSVLHEADITKFYKTADSIISKRHKMSNLKQIRTGVGITQEKLASESGVSLRSIQMYEQRNKDINKAQVMSLVKIARCLGCDVEDLLE